MKSFHLHSPPCPYCGCKDTRLTKSPADLARLGLLLTAGMVNALAPFPFAPRIRRVCRSCDGRFGVNPWLDEAAPPDRNACRAFGYLLLGLNDDTERCPECGTSIRVPE
jgi:hypothetical protein